MNEEEKALPVMGDVDKSYSIVKSRDSKKMPGRKVPPILVINLQGRFLTIFAESRQRPDVVDESLDEIFVSVWLVLDDQVDLLADGGGRNFDFELVFFFTLVGNLFQAN